MSVYKVNQVLQFFHNFLFVTIFAKKQKFRQTLPPTIIISTNITLPETSSGQDLRGFVYL